jgi:hypothetical protein
MAPHRNDQLAADLELLSAYRGQQTLKYKVLAKSAEEIVTIPVSSTQRIIASYRQRLAAGVRAAGACPH